MVSFPIVVNISLSDDVAREEGLWILEALEGVEFLSNVGVIEDPLLLIVQVAIVELCEVLASLVQRFDHLEICRLEIWCTDGAVAVNLAVDFQDLDLALSHNGFEILHPDIEASVQVPIEDRELFPKCDPQSCNLVNFLDLDASDTSFTTFFHLESEMIFMVVLVVVWELNVDSIDLEPFVERFELVYQWIFAVVECKNMLKISLELVTILFDHPQWMIFSVFERFLQFCQVLSERNQLQFMLEM